MMKSNTLKHSKVRVSTSPEEEAIAVLSEMERQAEQRLIEASQEFQDIAYEMEWRLHDWSRLTDEARKLERQLALTNRATPRFNMRARTLTASSDVVRKDQWNKMRRLLQERLEQNHLEREETLAAIMSGNDEGEVLQKEIFSLQDKARRIGRILQQNHRAPAIVIAEKDAVAALAQLSIISMQEDDLPNPSTLIAAAYAVGNEAAHIARDE